MTYELDFSKLTIEMGRWSMVWAQCMEDDKTRELWVGTETESCLVGYAPNRDSAQKAVGELTNMMEAVKLLKRGRNEV